MKSAYELAMERLQKVSPSVSLTDDQKREIAEIDSLFRSKIAEREVFLRDQLDKARIQSPVEAEAIEQELASDLRRLREECEEKKEAVRNRRE